MGLFRFVRGGFASALALALVAAASSGCPGRTDHYQGVQHLSVEPIVPGGSFADYTETTFGDAIDPNKQVYLLNVSVSADPPEFSWIANVTGSTPGGQPLLSKPSFDGAVNPVQLQVLDSGDIRPLFPDEHTFRINWEGNYTPSPEQTYPNGVELTITYTLQIE
jgi:hypothetical protein